jgi:hypothetical protein
MRSISANANAVLTSGAQRVTGRLQVKDNSGTLRDITTYAGFNMVFSLRWGEDIDSPGITWEASLIREQEQVSLSPMMEASPLNRGFDLANSYAPLLSVGRGMTFEWQLQAEDDGSTGVGVLAFSGYIDAINWGGDSIRLTGRGEEAVLIDTYVERERVYAFAQGANADRGCYIFEGSRAYLVGDLVIPTDGKKNGHFYKCTTAGTSASTEPSWNTGGASTTSSGSAVFTERGSTSTSVGTNVETVIQQFLNDNLGTGVVTLACPVSPGWQVRWFLIGRQPVFDELRGLADQIGWCIRYKYDAGSGTMKLTLFDPVRSNTTSERTFTKSEIGAVTKAAVDIGEIRNVVQVVYTDSQDLDPNGAGKRKVFISSDAPSITKFGRRFCEIAEGSASNIDSSSEAGTLAASVVSDLKDPTADFEVDLNYFFPFIETTDLYTLAANGVHFDTDQVLAVAGYSHTIEATELTTRMKLRGKPSSGGWKTWMAAMTDSFGAEHHQLGAAETGNPMTITTDSTPVGGARIAIDFVVGKRSLNTEHEVHLSLSPGFSPSASTLVATGKSRNVEIGNLDPAKTYYGRAVPITYNAQKPIRGSPSEEFSFTPGVAIAGHVSQDVNWGRLPLNGGFETQFDPLTVPDWWTVRPSFVWGTNLYLQSDANGKSGGNYLVAKTLSTIDSGGLYSAYFPVEAGEPYTITLWKKCVAGSGNNFYVTANFSNYAKVFVSNDVSTFDLGTDVGVWAKIQVTGTAPATAKFGRVAFDIGPGASGREVHLDSMVFEQPREEGWHAVGGTGEPAFQNSWVNFGSTYAPARFRKDINGWVTLDGLVKNGTINTVAFTLPVGYRPATNEELTQVVKSGAGTGAIEVQADGDVVAFTASNSSFSLAGIRFKAA